MVQTRKIDKADLPAAKEGSYYTIVGVGGDLEQWIAGYEGLLEAQEIGRPAAWFTTSGKDVNEFVGPVPPERAFQPDLTFLLFPLGGLDTGKLAMFKLRMGDRWFDDVVDNARR